MAIHIYLCDVSLIKDRYVRWNDFWFDSEVYKKYDMTAECKKLMWRIDGSIYQGDDKFLSKYNKAMLDTLYLSTGCKTAINCSLFSDKIFECAEVGENALVQILNLKEASLHFSIWMPPLFQDIANTFVLHTTKNMSGEVFKYYMDLYERARDC